VTVPAPTASASHTLSEQRETRTPLTGIRKLSAANLEASHRDIPSVHIVEECDITGLDRRRLVAVVLHAMGRLAAEHPAFNAHFVAGEIVSFSRSDIAIAVDTPRGLMVPVVRDCGERSVDELHDEIARLAERARAGRITLSDVRDATTTLTSPGKLGGVLATPMINPPQTAIIGIHRAVERVVPRDGELAVRTISNLTVTFDHRAADGVAAGAYTLALARRIEAAAQENPS